MNAFHRPPLFVSSLLLATLVLAGCIDNRAESGDPTRPDATDVSGAPDRSDGEDAAAVDDTTSPSDDDVAEAPDVDPDVEDVDAEDVADADPQDEDIDVVEDADADAEAGDAAEDVDVEDVDVEDADATDVSDAESDADPATESTVRVVVAGDSWSTGLAIPLRDAIRERGLEHVEVSWTYTANAGSQARTWMRNEHPPAAGGGQDVTRPRMLDALHDALDAPADRTVLFLVLSGNDLNRECHDGWGTRSRSRREAAMDGIEQELEALVNSALAGRPSVEVVLVGYDYFHFEFLVAFGLRLDGLDTASYNGAFIDLGLRQRAIASRHARVHYAHNLGLLQWAYGDEVRPPFSIPNPFTGHPPYDAHVAPKPIGPPGYDNWPAGFYTYPAPLNAMPDGIHPTPEANRIIADNVLDQVMLDLLEVR